MERAQGLSASRARLAGAVLALVGAGCTFTHRHTIPQPIVEPPPSLRIDATVGVRLEPDLDARERVFTRTDGLQRLRSVIPVGTAVRSLCDGLLPGVFARTKPLSAAEPPKDVDAVLDVRLVSFELSWPSGLDTDPCQAHVAVEWRLTTPAGEPIARWATDTVGEQPRPTFGSCIGDSVALALQDAGRAFTDELLSDAAVRAWMERGGIGASPPPQRPPAGPPAPSPVAAEPPGGAQVAWSAEPPDSEPPPRPRPVRKATPPRPGSSVFRLGVGEFSPRGAPGALEDPSGSIAFLAGATYRPLRPLGIDVDMTYALGEFASTTAPSPGLIETKSSRMTLSSFGISAGARAIAPLGPFQPWGGAGLLFLVSKLTLTGTTLGFPGEVDEKGATAGVYAAAGADLAVGGRWLVGGQCRWSTAEQSFGRLSAGGSGDVGGLMCLADVSLSWP